MPKREAKAGAGGGAGQEGRGDIRFAFAPDGPNPASATITGGSLSSSGAWRVNLFGITPFGAAALDPSSQTVTIGNSTPINGFQVPVSQWGTSFSLAITYADPPGTDPSDFSVTLQAPARPMPPCWTSGSTRRGRSRC